MLLSVIIVNYRSAGDILNCLASACKYLPWRTYEWIVVDNDSKDDSAARILGAFPFVRWLDMGYNAGFARANNEGIRHASGDVVLLLNPDTLMLDDATDQCFRRLASSPYMACGVQLLNPDGTPQISGNYAMRGGLNSLLPLPYAGDWVKRLGELSGVQKPNVPRATGVTEVDWINGAFLMVKKAAIEKAGLLDEDFFLFAEEAEWCSRLKKTGGLCIWGDLHVVHLQGETANKSFGSTGKGYYNLFDRKGLQIMVSNFVRIRKQFGAGWFLLLLLLYTAEVPVFFTGLLLSSLFSRHRYSWRQLGGYCGNLWCLWRKSPIILRNRPYFYKML